MRDKGNVFGVEGIHIPKVGLFHFFLKGYAKIPSNGVASFATKWGGESFDYLKGPEAS